MYSCPHKTTPFMCNFPPYSQDKDWLWWRKFYQLWNISKWRGKNFLYVIQLALLVVFEERCGLRENTSSRGIVDLFLTGKKKSSAVLWALLRIETGTETRRKKLFLSKRVDDFSKETDPAPTKWPRTLEKVLPVYFPSLFWNWIPTEKKLEVFGESLSTMTFYYSTEIVGIFESCWCWGYYTCLCIDSI